MSRKLTRDQAEHVATLVTNYAEFQIALSNADHYFIVYHGKRALAAIAELSLDESPFAGYFSVVALHAVVKSAQERLDYAEYRESQI
jgi:hypothetical protein